MLKTTNAKHKSRPELLALSGIFGVTLLSGTILVSSRVSADNDTVTDNISIEVPVSCTMGGTGQNSHNATLLPGTYSGASGSTYESGIGTTTLTTFCNDNNGFSIYAIGFTGNEDGNNILVGTSASGNATIPTKVYESTDTTSNWSMKVNKVENQSGQDPVAYNPENMTITNSFNSWHTVPDDYIQVAEYKATTGSSATDTALGGKVTTTYASFISTTQAADTYTGQVKYVMVHPYNGTAPEKPIIYSITYNANGGSDTVTNMPTNISNQSTYDTSVNIASTVPARNGYNFKGWCTIQTADGASCTGTTYNPDGGGTNLAWTLDQTQASNSLTLYAMWELAATPTVLYDAVASMSKGKNTDSSSNFSWTSITQPTSTNPATDTSSSGVFEWDGMTAGNGIDSNGGTQKIYFYRGILDTTLTSYGSDGLADAYPNYVRLGGNSTSSTCWRIVRTTSTGGVKMIYNGTWTGTTCANATTNAQTMYNGSSLNVLFNTTSSTTAGKTYTGLQHRNIHAVGYTYSNVAASTTTATAISTLFGSSGNDTTTNTNSSILKQYIEDWYASTLTSYTSKLEGDAGFCQDRRLNTSTTWTSPLAESTTIVPYGTSGLTQYYFGAYPRNAQSSTFNPLLTCPRGKVDLYSYSSNAGNGNGQLTYPVALLTADEASLAGDGWSNSFSVYNANSFLRSGSVFWLLSPYRRDSNGGAIEFVLNSSGNLSISNVSNARGVRPSISLTTGTSASSGSGTATDPWIVNP